MLNRRQFVSSLTAAGLAPYAARGAGENWEWQHYGGDAGASRFAPLNQINQSNVKDLKVAWVHNCGDHSSRPQTTIETTPICIDGVLYLQTPRLKTQAINAATGELLWTFDPRRGTHVPPPAGPEPGRRLLGKRRRQAEANFCTRAGHALRDRREDRPTRSELR